MNDSKDILGDIKKIDVFTLDKGEKHSKLVKGDKGERGDVTYKLTHKENNKKYFLRDVKFSDSSISTVLSSKIARVINKNHFSSEKWLSDGRVVSESVPQNTIPHPHATRQAYCVQSLTQKENHSQRTSLMKQLSAYNVRIENSHIKGIGIIDEVCAFIGEADPNCENLMFSNETFDDNTIAIKIDFDNCSLNDGYSYYTDNYAIYGKQVYKNFPLEYAKERALTRLKISLISDAMIKALLEKYCPENKRKKYTILLKNNRNLALQQLLSEKYGITQLLNNKEGFEKLTENLSVELFKYSQKHFPEKSSLLKSNLSERLDMVKKYLADKFYIPSPTFSSSTLMSQDASQFSSKLNMFPPKTTIQTNNESKPLLDKDNINNIKNDCCSPCTLF